MAVKAAAAAKAPPRMDPPGLGRSGGGAHMPAPGFGRAADFAAGASGGSGSAGGRRGLGGAGTGVGHDGRAAPADMGGADIAALAALAQQLQGMKQATQELGIHPEDIRATLRRRMAQE